MYLLRYLYSERKLLSVGIVCPVFQFVILLKTNCNFSKMYKTLIMYFEHNVCKMWCVFVCFYLFF